METIILILHSQIFICRLIDSTIVQVAALYSHPQPQSYGILQCKQQVLWNPKVIREMCVKWRVSDRGMFVNLSSSEPGMGIIGSGELLSWICILLLNGKRPPPVPLYPIPLPRTVVSSETDSHTSFKCVQLKVNGVVKQIRSDHMKRVSIYWN